MAIEYSGHWPSVVSRDAKYHMTWNGKVQLVYRESRHVEEHLFAVGHSQLASLVNDRKKVATGQPGGVFYINEYGHVVVPVGPEATCHIVGIYRELLEFPYKGTFLGPVPPRHLEPGDEWPGPHVGIPYILSAGGDDIKYKTRVAGFPNRFEIHYLSEESSPSYAERLARRLGRVKGWSGGRIFINEARAFFAPVEIRGQYRYLFLGLLDDDPWFPEPKV
jgi:hypothetical protein